MKRSTKLAFFGGDPVSAQIAQLIGADPSLTPGQRADIMKGVYSLNQSQKQNMLRTIGSLAGAGIGAAAMRFLRGSGVIGMTVGALGGALLGSRIGAATSGLRRQAGGLWTNNQVDIYGRHY